MNMKSVLDFVLKILKSVFPKSRWGNVIYLIIGFVSAHANDLQALINSIVELFK